jgi:hypothetical protein
VSEWVGAVRVSGETRGTLTLQQEKQERNFRASRVACEKKSRKSR